jgi:hypothetical protein
LFIFVDVAVVVLIVFCFEEKERFCLLTTIIIIMSLNLQKPIFIKISYLRLLKLAKKNKFVKLDLEMVNNMHV